MNISINHLNQVEPVARQNLEFNLDEIPKHWFGHDPFRSRFFDAICILFPDGERYFIESVRSFKP